MRQAQINVRTRACSRTSIARTKQAALTHNVRGKELNSSKPLCSSGYPGDAGRDGLVGFPGAGGLQGLRGEDGFPGIPGRAGDSASKGERGRTGNPGLTG